MTEPASSRATSGRRTGRGRVIMRAKTHFEDMEKGHRQAIIVDAIPYQVNKKSLLERIAELVRDKKLEGISDIRDESNREGVRIVDAGKSDGRLDRMLGATRRVVLFDTILSRPVEQIRAVAAQLVIPITITRNNGASRASAAAPSTRSAPRFKSLVERDTSRVFTRSRSAAA